MPSDATLVALFAATSVAAFAAWTRGQQHLVDRGQRLADALGLPPAPTSRRASFVRATRVAWTSDEVELTVLQWRAGGWAVAVRLPGHGVPDRVAEQWHRKWADIGDGLHDVDALPGWIAGPSRDADAALLDAADVARDLAEGAWHVRLAPDRCVALWPVGVDDAAVIAGVQRLRALRAALAVPPPDEDDA